VVNVDGKVETMISAGEIHGDERKRIADDVSKRLDDVKTEGDQLSRDKLGRCPIFCPSGIRYKGDVACPDQGKTSSR